MEIYPLSADSSTFLVVSFGVSILNTIVTLRGIAGTYLQICFGLKDTAGTALLACTLVASDVAMRASGFSFAAYLVGKALFSRFEDDIAILLALLLLLVAYAALSLASSLALRGLLGLGGAPTRHVALSSVLNLFAPYTLRRYLMKTVLESFLMFAAITVVACAWTRLASGPTHVASGRPAIEAIESIAAMILLVAFLVRNLVFASVLLDARLRHREAPHYKDSPAATIAGMHTFRKEAEAAASKGLVASRAERRVRVAVLVLLLMATTAGLIYTNSRPGSMSVLDCASFGSRKLFKWIVSATFPAPRPRASHPSARSASPEA